MTRLTYIRWMNGRDVGPAVALDAAGTLHPWCEAAVWHTLRDRSSFAVVAERGREIVGFAIYQLYTSHIRILHLAVERTCRREGIGTGLVADITQKLRTHKRHYLEMTLRENDLAAQCFLRACGLRAVAIIPDYWLDTGEAAYLMRSKWEKAGGCRVGL